MGRGSEFLSDHHGIFIFPHGESTFFARHAGEEIQSRGRAGHRAQGTGHRAQGTGTGHRAQGTGHRAQGTGHRTQAQGTGHRAQGTGHRAQGTGHRAQGTGHRAQGTGHRAQGTGHRAQGTGHRAQGTGQGRMGKKPNHRPSGRKEIQGRKQTRPALKVLSLRNPKNIQQPEAMCLWVMVVGGFGFQCA